MGCSMGRKCEVVILVGSAQAKSANAGLVNEIQKFVIERDLELRLVIPSLDGLPLFDEDIENAFMLPKEVKKLRDRVQKADALLIATPEINGSVSSLILNAFVWLSRSYGQGSPLEGKRAGVISASYLSQNQIVDCYEMGKLFGMQFYQDPFYLFLGNKVVDEAGVLTSAYERGRLQSWYKEFIKFVGK